VKQTNRGWVAMHRGETIDTLQEKYPNAFLLLCQIARRARVEPCPINDLDRGEALIGDYKKAGLLSERRYRTAKKRLEKCELVTFRGTNDGTIAKLLDKSVFSISVDKSDEQNDRQVTSKRRPSNDRVTTKNNVNKEKKENKETHSEPSKDEVCDELVKKVNSLRPDWNKPWTEADDFSFLFSGLVDLEDQMMKLTDKDWDVIRQYLAHTPNSTSKYWQPELRHKFIESFSNVHRQAAKWHRIKTSIG
jgi:hypothetical protein